MVANEVLALLRCPETRQPLKLADADLIGELEKLRAAGRLYDRSGTSCAEPIEGGLVRADGGLFFPIRDGIPVLIAAEAITLPVT
jgi:uncharacterized protein